MTFTVPRRIVVDLVPIRADAVNGGIKPLTLDLLAALADRGWRIAAICRADTLEHLEQRLPGVALHPLEPGESIETLYAALVAREGASELVFFPMQSASLLAPGVPSVSAVMDVQFADLPQNFTAAERAERERAFQSCVTLSDRIVAISRFTAERIVALSDFPAERIDTIPIAPAPIPVVAPEVVSEVLARSALRPDGYVLYPANFWPHKNHRRLIEAFGLFRHRTSSQLKLLLTGDPASPLGAEIADVAQAAPAGSVVMAGHVRPEDFAGLLGSARALIFPSLYEGFGMPVIEAMRLGIPVAAGWGSSLPEVANRAALLFDPLEPDAIVRAIERVAYDEALRHDLVARGLARAAMVGSHDQMVVRYEASFAAAIAGPRRTDALCTGLHSDGWMGRALSVAPPPGWSRTRFELEFEVPGYLPAEPAQLVVKVGGLTANRPLWRETSGRICRQIPEGSQFELSVTPTLLLSDRFAGTDRREVSLKVRSARLTDGRREVDLLDPAAEADGGRQPVLVVLSAPDDEKSWQHKGCLISDTPDQALRLTALSPNRLVVAEDDRADRSAGIAGLEGTPGPEIRIDATDPIEQLHLVAARPSDPALIPPIARSGGSYPRISVVIPSFNQGRFIGRTIESVLAQGCAEEVLVFDGGSTDETLEVLESFGSAIRFESGPDGGQAHAVNRGIAAARGDVIAWINSDDTYEPGAFAAVADRFADDPDLGVVYGEGCHIDEHDAVIERYPTEDFDPARLIETCFLCQPATFFRREVVERHGGLRESLRFCLDYELWLRLSNSGVRFQRIDAFLANTRFYPQTKTSGSRPQAHFEAADMLVRCFGVRSAPWIDHFAEIVVQDFVRPSRKNKNFAFEGIRTLARAFWDADAGDNRPLPNRGVALS